ncbi:pilus assembly protein TadG-related protein [Sinomonas sp. ASV322]|uniref:pilus assembly protein TadG-related protein n=1 Tax=Sinomonas sp. ASV322 TaxID=3041920 RepID=UPI0027DD4A2B|nr:pilus assembly protein TadG-related protein [Sinomonas sp. ASV322]MDQ4503227.1 hypothetical protein [Sinomonas sp. ASV322]
MNCTARVDESGQLTILIIGYAILCLLVAGVVTGVSAIHIEHKKLLSVADGAAQAAADSFTLADASQGEGPPAAALGTDRVRAVVNTYLAADMAAAGFEGLAVEGTTGSPDARTAQVTLSAVARVPLVSMLMPDGVQIEATSTARARLTR